MEEVKITKEDYDKINKHRYDREWKYNYINKLIGHKYIFTEDTTFVTYEDKHFYYLVFDGIKKESGKIQPSSIVDRITKKLKENI